MIECFLQETLEVYLVGIVDIGRDLKRSKERSLYISAASCKTLLIFKCLLSKIWDKLQPERTFKCLQLLLIPLCIEKDTKALIQFRVFFPQKSLGYFLSHKLTTLSQPTARVVKEKRELCVYTSTNTLCWEAKYGEKLFKVEPKAPTPSLETEKGAAQLENGQKG